MDNTDVWGRFTPTAVFSGVRERGVHIAEVIVGQPILPHFRHVVSSYPIVPGAMTVDIPKVKRVLIIGHRSSVKFLLPIVIFAGFMNRGDIQVVEVLVVYDVVISFLVNPYSHPLRGVIISDCGWCFQDVVVYSFFNKPGHASSSSTVGSCFSSGFPLLGYDIPAPDFRDYVGLLSINHLNWEISFLDGHNVDL